MNPVVRLVGVVALALGMTAASVAYGVPRVVPAPPQRLLVPAPLVIPTVQRCASVPTVPLRFDETSLHGPFGPRLPLLTLYPSVVVPARTTPACVR